MTQYSKLYKLTLLISVFLVALSGCKDTSKDLSYIDVVNRLTDMKRLAELPDAGEESGMFSSYDRKSKYDSAENQYVNWSANNDGWSPQYIRKEGENMVLAEMEGPGAIVRMWSASPKDGHVMVFIDGDTVPAIDMPFIDYFNPGALPAFNYPELVYETAARGFNNYVPITFEKSIKIVGAPEWGQYYHFNYITFPEGQKVETFPGELSAEQKSALQRVNDWLGNDIGSSPYRKEGSNTETIQVQIAPDNEQELISISQNAAISSFKVNISSIPEENREEALRMTTLKMFWDGSDEPAVWSPLGDFFGSAPGYNEYKTLPAGMQNDWMYAYWYMPFEQARIVLHNHSDFEVSYEVEITYGDIEKSPDQLGRFHAKWHRDLEKMDDARWPDWTLLETEGKERFLGAYLLVWNPKGGHCKRYGGEGHHWWGEGDEKFFVDGEKFPSTFGTGTEDYFGYAWCVPNYFDRPFHSQNYTEENMGYQSLNRWQIIDNVPFQSKFEGYLEKYFPNHWPTQYATVVYWYLSPEGNDPLKPMPADSLMGYENQYQVFQAPDAVEGEELEVVSNTGGWTTNDAFVDESLFEETSGHKMMLWFAKPDAENQLRVRFTIENTGTYRLGLKVIKSKDGGEFQVLKSNGQKLGTIDLSTDAEQATADMVELTTVSFDNKSPELIFKWTGKDDKKKRLAIDYIELKPLITNQSL
jgi:hypothetical protein